MDYKYIIVDEFQDISNSRYKLMEAIKNKTNAKTFCVGDDWQAIYRFAGCDLDYLLHFESYFGYSKIMKIERTYRYSQELIDVVEPFILKNPNQIQKKMRSTKHESFPVRVIRYGDDEKRQYDGLIDALNEIVYSIQKEGQKLQGKTVLLLLRNKYDLAFLNRENAGRANRALKETTNGHQAWRAFLYDACPELKINATTVHSAKGTQADYVIIVNGKNERNGFPNKMYDDPIFQILRPNCEEYSYAEERRLFYVALTRTQRCVYILAPTNIPSEFVEEIMALPNVETKYLGDTILTKKQIPCPRCGRGHLVLRKNKTDGTVFVGCSLYPGCDRKYGDSGVLKNPIRCKKCGGYLVHVGGKKDLLGCSNYPLCREIVKLPGSHVVQN